MTLIIIKILWILSLIITQIIIIVDVNRLSTTLLATKETLDGYSWMINPTHI